MEEGEGEMAVLGYEISQSVKRATWAERRIRTYRHGRRRRASLSVAVSRARIRVQVCRPHTLHRTRRYPTPEYTESPGCQECYSNSAPPSLSSHSASHPLAVHVAPSISIAHLFSASCPALCSAVDPRIPSQPATHFPLTLLFGAVALASLATTGPDTGGCGRSADANAPQRSRCGARVAARGQSVERPSEISIARRRNAARPGRTVS